MEEENTSKPGLSFGISSILSSTHVRRQLLPTKLSNIERQYQSPFRPCQRHEMPDIQSDREDTGAPKESQSASLGNSEDEYRVRRSSKRSHSSEEHHICTHCKCSITYEPPSIQFNNRWTHVSSKNAKRQHVDVETLESEMSEERLDAVKCSGCSLMKCQPTVLSAPVLPSTTFPIIPGIPTPSYLFKSLERIQPKVYSEYRRVGHPYSNRTPPKRKKPRTTFNRDQIAELEARFVGQKYLASTERLRLAKHLQLTDSQVKTWFQNRRTKWRRQTAEEREAERNAATKYIMKIQQQQQSAAVVQAANVAAIWPSLLAAHGHPATVTSALNLSDSQ